MLVNVSTVRQFWLAVQITLPADNTLYMKKYLGYGGLVLVIFGLVGIISQTGPLWARFTLLLGGVVVIILAKSPKHYKE